MSDAVVAAATAEATGTPAAEPTPEAPAIVDEAPTLASAVAAYKAAVAAKAEPEKPAAAKAESQPETPASPEVEPAKELDAGDAKLAKVFNRISRLEDELKAARGEAETHKTRAQKADQLEAEKALFLKDPEQFFKTYGWDQETIRDYIVNGPKAVKPEVAHQRTETETLKAQLAELKAELTAKEESKQVEAAKARIPATLAPDANKFPTLYSYYDQPSEMADAIFSVIHATYQQQKTVLTIHEAAQAVEKVLSDQAKRFSRPRSKDAEPSTKTPAPKPVSPTLTNVPPSTSNKPIPIEESPDEDNFEAALAVMRSARK